MPRSITLEEKHPELFAKDNYIHPRDRKRVTSIEVLCLGYMRTGTACKSRTSIFLTTEAQLEPIFSLPAKPCD